MDDSEKMAADVGAFDERQVRNYHQHRQVHMVRGHAWSALQDLVNSVLMPLHVGHGFMERRRRTEGRRASALELRAELGDLAALCRPLDLEHTQVETEEELAQANEATHRMPVLRDSVEEVVERFQGSRYFHYLLGLSSMDDLSPAELEWRIRTLRPLLHPKGFFVHFADVASPPQVAHHIADQHPHCLALPCMDQASGALHVKLFPRSILNVAQSTLCTAAEAKGEGAILGKYLADPLLALTDEHCWRVGCNVLDELSKLDPGVQSVGLNDFSTTSLQYALEKEGFTVFLNEELEKVSFLDRLNHHTTVYGTDSDANMFQVVRGVPVQAQVQMTLKRAPLFSDPVTEQCRVHVTMATVAGQWLGDDLGRTLRLAELAGEVRDSVRRPPPCPIPMHILCPYC